MKRVVFAGFLAVGLVVPSGATAQDTDINRYTLEDLGGVFVRIEVGDACQGSGITSAAYEANVSLQLIEAEVGVLTRSEMLTHPAMPELRISLDCAGGANGSAGAMAYSVGLRVQQAAQMLRDTQITLPEAVTWYALKVGVTSPGEAAEDVGATLTEQVALFAAAWASAHEGGEGR
ncbi:MAG: hypothetical protein O2958_03185 [Gemmatimonadetes bacterium]|nr:hypothetical protein [Gemmatimonadota bacterium]MDA1102322.1 hypothetical protein [Gemmatimonadota bacterium]